jgi:hypothetical protein
MLSTVCACDFQPLEKSLCQLTIAEDYDVAIELANVVEKPNAAISLDDPNTRIPFSLLLKTPLEHAFDASYCHFHHPTLGILENLLINRVLPPHPNDQSAWYQIIFA